MRYCLMVLVILLADAGIGVGTASAYLERRGTGSGNDKVYVAMIDVVGDGTSDKVPVVCFDSNIAGWDKYYILGNQYGLDNDYHIHGDSTDSGTGVDDMRIGWTGSGYCAGIIASGSPSSLLYNGHYLDLYGDGGNDIQLWDGGGSNDTWLFGGDGGDYLQQSSSVGRADGNAGNDTVWGLDGNNDALFGGSGADCLWDANNSFLVLDCGNDAGDVRDSRNSWTPGCPNSQVCCGFC